MIARFSREWKSPRVKGRVSVPCFAFSVRLDFIILSSHANVPTQYEPIAKAHARIDVQDGILNRETFSMGRSYLRIGIGRMRLLDLLVFFGI